jgi:hypothetical protein
MHLNRGPRLSRRLPERCGVCSHSAPSFPFPAANNHLARTSACASELRSTEPHPDNRKARPDANTKHQDLLREGSGDATWPAHPSDAVDPEDSIWLQDAEALYGEGSRWVEWQEYKARIHYVRKGSAGPPLLLLHGFGVGGYHFDRNIDHLAKHHRVWAVDLLGQGASWPLAPVESSLGLQYSIDTWVAQLAFFIQQVMQCEGGVYVAGNSLGGLLAVTLAYFHPKVLLLTPVMYRYHCHCRCFRHCTFPDAPTVEGFWDSVPEIVCHRLGLRCLPVSSWRLILSGGRRELCRREC